MDARRVWKYALLNRLAAMVAKALARRLRSGEAGTGNIGRNSELLFTRLEAVIRGIQAAAYIGYASWALRADPMLLENPLTYEGGCGQGNWQDEAGDDGDVVEGRRVGPRSALLSESMRRNRDSPAKKLIESMLGFLSGDLLGILFDGQFGHHIDVFNAWCPSSLPHPSPPPALSSSTP